MMDEPELDDDGYPTEATLKLIREWTVNSPADSAALLALIKPIWQYSDCGYWDEEDVEDEFTTNPVHEWRISTAGWSGNEDIIGALMDNRIFWMMHWQSSRRGGHYVFR